MNYITKCWILIAILYVFATLIYMMARILEQSLHYPPEDALEPWLPSALQRVWSDCTDTQADLSLS